MVRRLSLEESLDTFKVEYAAYREVYTAFLAGLHRVVTRYLFDGTGAGEADATKTLPGGYVFTADNILLKHAAFLGLSTTTHELLGPNACTGCQNHLVNDMLCDGLFAKWAGFMVNETNKCVLLATVMADANKFLAEKMDRLLESQGKFEAANGG